MFLSESFCHFSKFEAVFVFILKFSVYLRVEFLLKTESGYLRDAEVTCFHYFYHHPHFFCTFVLWVAFLFFILPVFFIFFLQFQFFQFF